MTAVIMVDGKEEIDGKEGIAHVVERAEAKENVVDGTDSAQTEEVENGIAEGKSVANIIDGGQSDDEDGPYRG